MMLPRFGLREMDLVGQTVVQGLQGISSVQKKTGCQEAQGSTVPRSILSPGFDLSTSRLAIQVRSSSTFSPMSFARERAAMRPPNMALEASAISSASPAETAVKPKDLACRYSSSQDERPRGYEDGVNLEGASRVEEGPPGPVYGRDGRALDAAIAFHGDHARAEVDGHAHADDLVRVDLVTVHLVEDLDDAGDLDARLEGMVGADEAHVARADDEDTLRGA